MDDIIIIDDVVDVELQQALEKLCVSDGFGWIYNPVTAYSDYHIQQHGIPESFLENSVDTPLFTHLLWSDYGRNSHYFNNFVPILDTIPNINHLHRVKVNLTLPHKDVTPETRSFPHVDYRIIEKDFTTGIYYINDSDGDTYIFNEQFDHVGPLTIKQRITPKRGRLVLFNGKLLHSGNNPTQGVRLIANINFT